MYIAAGQGQTTPGDNLLSVRSFATSFKKIFSKSDFIQFFFMILYMYIAPGHGLTTPWGRNFDVNWNILSLRSFVASFKPETHGPQRSPECTGRKTIFSQNTVNVARKKN